MLEDNEHVRSDHKMIEVVWEEESSKGISQVNTGCNNDSMQEDDLKQAKEWWKGWRRKRDTLSDESTIQQLADQATTIRETPMEVLNQKAKKTRGCATSKRWWNQNIVDNRNVLGNMKRNLRRVETKDASV